MRVSPGIRARRLVVASACALVMGGATVFSGAAIAAGQESVIKYRRTLMKGVGAHMGAMAQLAKGEVPHRQHMLVHAKALAMSLPLAADAFKAQTDGGDTTALPKIWEDWSGFEGKLSDAKDASAALVAALEAGDGTSVGEKFKALGKACGSCHKAYRKKKKR